MGNRFLYERGLGMCLNYTKLARRVVQDRS